MLMNRDLDVYLNQLRRAKIVCERCITERGGESYLIMDSGVNKESLSNRKIINLKLILSSIKGRHYFHQFLETFGTQSLIRFWYEVWKLESAKAEEKYRMANYLYNSYIMKFGNAVRDEIDDVTVSQMRKFLLGELSEPDAFFQAQTTIFKVLQRDFYASFLVSKQYSELCDVFDQRNLEDFDLRENFLEKTTPSSASETLLESEAPSNSAGNLAESSEYVPKRFIDLRNQLMNKKLALQAAKTGSTFDEKVLQTMENDCISLSQEISTLETLMENIELWWQYIGRWRAEVLVDLVGNCHSNVAVLIRNTDSDQNQRGWVIIRSLFAWQHFFFRMKDLEPSLPNIDLLKLRGRDFNRFTWNQQYYLKFVNDLEGFLQRILTDERLSSFEFVYQFLNPSIVSFHDQSSIFKESENKSMKLNNKLELSEELSELDSRFLDDRADSIAQPFYRFIDVLFDEQGLMLKFIRTTLVNFIRATYGSTINRQVRRFIAGLIDEESFVRYFIMFRDVLWPTNVSRGEKKIFTDEEKRDHRRQAKQQLLLNIPETLTMIFGTENARLGAENLFELFQDVRLNKHLFYNLIFLIIKEIFPEFKLR